MATKVYESWDLALPNIPARSPFHSLTPRNVDTAQVEALSDYLARLVASHQISINDILRTEPFLDSNLDSKPWATRVADLSYSINGVGQEARVLANNLRKLTLRNDLEKLTLLSFRDVISQRPLFHKLRAWCPICLEQMRKAGETVYEHLSWCIECVECCFLHSVPLSSTCLVCGRFQRPLTAWSRPGFCSACGAWLGSDFQDRNFRLSEYQLWSAEAVGQMLVQASILDPNCIKQNMRTILTAYAERAFEGNMLALADAVRCKRLVFKSWCEGKSVASLSQLLRISYELELPISVLLGGQPTELSLSPPEDVIVVARERNVGSKRPRERIRKILQKALSADRPQSISELAHSLGYASTWPLYASDPELCHRITKRYRALGRGYRWKKNGAGRLCDKTRLEKILKNNLSQACPKPISQLAAECGYSNSAYILTRFKDVCRATATKRAEYMKSIVTKIKSELEAAAKAVPPPMLSEIARKCELHATSQLRRYAPDLCDRLLLARKAFVTDSRAQLQRRIESLLGQDPPLSVREIANRTGVKPDMLRHSFPDLCREIGAKFREHMQKLSQAKLDAMYQIVHETVARILLRNERPTKDRVLKYATAKLPQRWDVIYAAVKKAREELTGKRDSQSARIGTTTQEGALTKAAKVKQAVAR